MVLISRKAWNAFLYMLTHLSCILSSRHRLSSNLISQFYFNDFSRSHISSPLHCSSSDKWGCEGPSPAKPNKNCFWFYIINPGRAPCIGSLLDLTALWVILLSSSFKIWSEWQSLTGQIVFYMINSNLKNHFTYIDLMDHKVLFVCYGRTKHPCS